MKLCSRCGAAGPFKGTCNYCQKCQSEYFKKRYQDHYKAGVKERRDENIRTILMTIQEAKMKPCKRCKKRYPYFVMDLHHARGEKEFMLSKARRRNMSVEKVKAEIAKCDVLCANCHRIESFKEVAEAGFEPARP
jgi:hypothetical protein